MKKLRKEGQKDAPQSGTQPTHESHHKEKRTPHPKSHLRSWVGRHRLLVLLTALAVLVLLFLFGAKLALLANFLLGNDVIISLSADKEALSLARGENATVTFGVSVTTNPFCSASCDSVFEDLSAGSIVDEASFSVRPAIPEKKAYAIQATRIGTGLDVYRFRVECKSVRTLLCHTDEEPTARSILLTVTRNLTAEEREAQQRSGEVIAALLGQAAELQGRQAALRAAMIALNETLDADELLQEGALIERQLADHHAAFERLRVSWGAQELEAVVQQLGALQARIAETETSLGMLTEQAQQNISALDALGSELQDTWQALAALRAQPFTNASRAAAVNESTSSLNALTELFGQRMAFSAKDELVRQPLGELRTAIAMIQHGQDREALARALEADISADALCLVRGACVAHPSIAERAAIPAALADACVQLEAVRAAAPAINQTDESYPDTTEFRQNITLKLRNIKSGITLQYRAQLPPNASNTPLLEELLLPPLVVETADYGGLNLTAALTAEIVSRLPAACVFVNASFEALSPVAVPNISIGESAPLSLAIAFAEPVPQCCLQGQCQPCCASASCREEAKLAPVVFLHGHAFNKDTSAEYSLDAFNTIQQRLEKDGYISAGAISLYTPQDAAQEAWGMLTAPLTIKASYYLDLFQEPENYVVVQTKSENIDTYAVRLKELIDTITQKTGRPKVVLVTHSMGGLVARRYLQVFGSDEVAKLIMVGTANSGIAGSIADYCPLVGEKLECRDMHTSSLFMNKLNRGRRETIPIVNIIGTGCAMDGGTGDGIVLAERAELEGAQNILVEGVCDGFETLHTELLDTDRYPEVYEIIREALREG